MNERPRDNEENLKQETVPTNLELFFYHPNLLIRTRKFHEDMTNLLRAKTNDTKNRHNQSERLDVTLNAIDETREEIGSELRLTVSSVAVSKAYLIFLQDLIPKGMSKENVFDFFKICLAVNTKIDAVLNPTTSEDIGQFRARVIVSQDSFAQKEIAKIENSAMQRLPSWFTGTKEDYSYLVKNYTNFTRLCNQRGLSTTEAIEELKKMKKDLQENGLFEKSYGETLVDGLPDWFLNNDGKLPFKEEVEAELQSDLEEEDNLRSKIMSLHRKSKYLVTSFNEKADKSRDWFDDQSKKNSNGIVCNLATNLIFAHAVPSNGEEFYKILLKNIAWHPNPELYSLWIEGKLKVAGIISDEGLNTECLESLRTWIAFQRKETPEAEATFKAMRYTNKEGYNILWHELGPIIDALSEDRVDLLKEFIGDSKKCDPNSLVTFLADLFFEEINEMGVTGGLSRSLDSCYSFNRKFINQHSEWLYSQLIKRLYHEQTEPIGVIAEDPFTKSEPEILLEQFDAELAEENRDKLVGWKVFYSMDKKSEDSSLVEIPGDTCEERSRFLQQFIGSHSLSCSVKASVVIKSLESKTESVGTVEDFITHKKRINGEVWKKIHKDPIRIFYQMQPDEKILIFSIHQKKADGYGF